MQYLDPRLWVLRYPRLTIALFLLVTGLFLWGNARLTKGGILDEDVILQPDDPVRLMDRYVQAKHNQGFDGKEAVPFILNGGLGSAQDLARVARTGSGSGSGGGCCGARGSGGVVFPPVRSFPLPPRYTHGSAQH